MGEELIKSLRHFLMRDAFYLVGGSTVVVAFLHLLDRLPPKDLPGVWLILGAGVAYGIGLAVQEVSSLLPLVSTAPVVRPRWLVRFLYGRYCRVPWKPIDSDSWGDKVVAFEQAVSERQFAQYQRIIALKHAGATLGSNWLIVGGLLVSKYLTADRREPLDAILGLAAVACSVALIGVCWIHGAQQAQFVARCLRQIPSEGGKAPALARTPEAEPAA